MLNSLFLWGDYQGILKEEINSCDWSHKCRVLTRWHILRPHIYSPRHRPSLYPPQENLGVVPWTTVVFTPWAIACARCYRVPLVFQTRAYLCMSWDQREGVNPLFHDPKNLRRGKHNGVTQTLSSLRWPLWPGVMQEKKNDGQRSKIRRL
jgi:hypothetical protein